MLRDRPGAPGAFYTIYMHGLRLGRYLSFYETYFPTLLPVPREERNVVEGARSPGFVGK